MPRWRTFLAAGITLLAAAAVSAGVVLTVELRILVSVALVVATLSLTACAKSRGYVVVPQGLR